MNLEEFRTTEKVKISFLKHRGFISEIVKETKLPEEYVRKMVSKFEKEETREVSVLIANNLMSIIMQGVQSRIIRYQEMLNSLEGREQLLLSSCCDYPVRSSIVDNLELFTCLKCGKNCNTVEGNKISIYKIKKEILQELRNEDIALIEMAEKLGYTNKPLEGPTTVIQNKQQILVVNSDKDKEAAKNITDMSLISQQQLLERLTKEITHLDEEINGEGVRGSEETPGFKEKEEKRD